MIGQLLNRGHTLGGAAELPLERVAERHIERQIADPALRARVTPDYTIEVSAPALRRFSDGIQRRLRRAVWSQGGCTSWYLDADGVNRALWPGFSFEYWARTRRARTADYAIR